MDPQSLWELGPLEGPAGGLSTKKSMCYFGSIYKGKFRGPILIRDLIQKSLIKLVLLDPPGGKGPIGPGVTLAPLGTIWIPIPIGFN